LREEEPALTVRIAIGINIVFDEANKLKPRLFKRNNKKYQTEAKYGNRYILSKNPP
jgi:hypothetical protein